MSNHLKDETSPYLLQHAENPVAWYPWGKAAFEKAKAEDKPIFLSIGYSTCHWCHVMARESFEDPEVAALLNASFVSIKVDREERPDIDSIYMTVCQAFTGGGGWPTSIFMTPEKKPFFAGTYFPKNSGRGAVGLVELLRAIREKWNSDRESLLRSADGVVDALSRQPHTSATADAALIDSAVARYKRSFDAKYGGFGGAPKFPAPHNLLFLMTCFEKSGDQDALRMAETTLTQMYRGGLFDHVGYGFCRYSTDRFFLVPHFEKMLYDNALLMLAYCKAYSVAKKPFYRLVAEKAAAYVLREMTSPDGGFYSAQDADSEGAEGAYYTFSPDEIIGVLGEKSGQAFNRHYRITAEGNFEGKSIPNLLPDKEDDPAYAACLPAVYAYRRSRRQLRLDDKILTAWNGLMIAAMCRLYRAGGKHEYLLAAKRAQRFIESNLFANGRLFVSMRGEKRSEHGFLDDYACYLFALLALYEATLDAAYLDKAETLCTRAVADFYDPTDGGFYLYGSEGESMIFRPKETQDGAIPSGNSMMAYNLVRLSLLTGGTAYDALIKNQLAFLSGAAQQDPAGYAMFLTALSDYLEPPTKVTVVTKERDGLADLPSIIQKDVLLSVAEYPSESYSLKDGRTTFYVCKSHSCLPPVNDLRELNAILGR